jgi:hypothetical protein
MRPPRSIAALLLALALGYGQGAAFAAKAPPPLRVLFVGNSYLYVNDLPQLVADVAAARGIALHAGMLAEANFAIEDHLERDDYATRLDEGWDWVVLQQGPSSLPANQDNLRIFAGQAATMAQARGARVALMSAWPALPNAHTWPAAETSYRLAALANGLCVLPVSSAWRAVHGARPGIRLYQADQLHAEREGTLLAALVIVRGLVRRPAHVDPPPLASSAVDASWRDALQHTAELDDYAQRAVALEGPNCLREKHDVQHEDEMDEPASGQAPRKPR